MSAEQKLIKIEEISEANAPAIYVAGGLQQFITLVKAEVEGEVPDLKTRKGRERIASLAAKVSKSKTAVEKPGRDYLRRLKEMPKVVEAELREFVTAMDALRDETRRPLTEWEDAEAARVAAHEQAIARLRAHGADLAQLTSEDLLDRIGTVDGIALGEAWEEFAAEAGQVKDQVLVVLRESLASRQKYEAEQAELARLRAEQEAREKADREAAIAREAEDRARAEAERKAQAEREVAERRELELKLQAEQAERAKAQAEAGRLEAEQLAEQERQNAAKRAEEAAELARQDERRRADEAAAEIIRQQDARERDKAHRRTVNRAALDAFVAGGMTEECAKQAITLIAERKIPNINIQY